MILAERVNSILSERRGRAICDDCVAKALDVSPRNQINPITNALGTTRDFHRETGMCSDCGTEAKKVTRRA